MNKKNVSNISTVAAAMAVGCTKGSNLGLDIKVSTRTERVSQEPVRTKSQEAPNSPSEKASVSDEATTAGPRMNEKYP
jgi:hypothetical protein